MRRLFAVILLSGCGARSGLFMPDAGSGPDAGEAGPDGGPDGGVVVDAGGTDAAPDDPVCNPYVQSVDLLFVIDDSGSMAEEQVNLAQNLPVLIDAVASPPDTDGDGEPDFPRVDDLHVGVVSTDMGTGTFQVCPGGGDDGVLLHDPSALVAGCADAYPTFLSHDAGTADDAFARDFACISRLGTEGCGLEQALYAMESAVGSHAAPGGPNAGFLRDEAVLAVVLVGDEDDCSASDDRLFDPDRHLGEFWHRCVTNPTWLRDPAQFVLTLLATKSSASHVSVAAIVGVPTDLVDLSEADLLSEDLQTDEDFADVLADPRMVPYVVVEDGIERQLACSAPGLGAAYPANRIVDFVRGVDEAGGRGLVQSICQDDWSVVMRGIARSITCPE